MGVKQKLDSCEHSRGLTMDAIKKKMQAMKVEKDNACDRCDVCEEASKVAKLRAEKAEDEVAELAAKSRQLETELDLTTEKLGIVSLQLEEKEKSLLAAEAEMNALNRRVSGLEEDLEKTEEKLVAANTKLEQQLMTLSVPRRSLKTKQLKMTKELLVLKKNWKMQEIRLKQQMQLMRKYLRNCYNVMLSLKRLRREQISVKSHTRNRSKP